MNSKTILDHQRARPDYLNSQFPRAIHAWGKFSQREQEQLKQWERESLWKQGYAEQPDGSYVKL